MIKTLLLKIRDYLRKPKGFKNTTKVRFGKNVVIESCKSTTIGDYSFIGKNVVIGKGKVSIGSYTSIGPDSIIGLNNHPLNWISSSPVFYSSSWGKSKMDFRGRFNSENTIIGSDVWIGSRVMIKAGVSIGHGAVIGAGSIVTKNVEPYSIVAGLPAKFIRYRFDEKARLYLLKSQWFNTDFKDLNIEQFTRPYDGEPIE